MQLKYIIAAALITIVALSACNKKISAITPTLGITINNQRTSVGDTLYFTLGDTVKFNMAGYADNIMFYSGEIAHQYQYANRTTAIGVPVMSFTSNAVNGTQTNTLQVLATDKLAMMDSSHIVGASWTDITSRAVLSTGSGAVASGNINLSDLVSGPTDSLFFAFKYTGITGSIQRTWTITNLVVNNLLADSTPAPLFNIANESTAYWIKFNQVYGSANWVPTTSLTITGGTTTAPNNVGWIVSRPMYVNRTVPDLPTTSGVLYPSSSPLKQFAQAMPVYTLSGINYTGGYYKYPTKGLYLASFAYSSLTKDDNQSGVKQFWIRVN